VEELVVTSIFKLGTEFVAATPTTIFGSLGGAPKAIEGINTRAVTAEARTLLFRLI
jgi:hypothetical protein